MAEKKMSSGGMCPGCHSNPCKCMMHGYCGNRWCKAFCGLLVFVLGLLLIWPMGWFTFNHTLGVLVALAGLWKLCHCLFMCN